MREMECLIIALHAHSIEICMSCNWLIQYDLTRKLLSGVLIACSVLYTQHLPLP